MFKKIAVTGVLATTLFTSLGILENEASAASLSATPSTQTIRNAVATANWQLSWSGTAKYDLAFRPDSGLSWINLNSQTTTTSRPYSYRYDLGAQATDIYYGQFFLSDYYSTAYKNVTVNHYRSTGN